MSAIRTMQRFAYEWAIKCFGIEHVKDHKVRALRLVEEAIELAQCVGVEQEKINACTKIVYSKEHGPVRVELGSVMVTAAVFAQSMHLDLEGEFEGELFRLFSKPPSEHNQRNQNKVNAGLS